MIDKSSEWKLPPNVYRLKDNFEEVSRKQMGRLGPYRCFTLERDAKTVKNHLSTKPLEDECDIFYDVPSSMGEMMMMPRNRYRSRFVRGERFDRIQQQQTPPPTKYFPQNFVMKTSTRGRPKSAMEKPLFYYPSTTVPVKEMLFNKEPFFKPPPGRYEPHDVTCKCYLNRNRKCPGNVSGNGHQHVFESTFFRLVRPVPVDKKRIIHDQNVEEIFPRRERDPRQLISFRLKRSISLGDIGQPREREIRFNTMVKKKNWFSVKTGRPVAFLTASPRFKSSSEVSLTLEKQSRQAMLEEQSDEKPPRKPITKKRLAELATPKNPREKIISHRIKVFEPLPSPKKVAKKLSSSETAMSETEQEEEVVGNASVVYKAPSIEKSLTNSSN